ncbi:MAG: hypothetical protein EBQ82_00725 [Betaproteobacteria bacterium]|nr:hypothetical protein [Betaproteobacteria bacterium]NBY03936.1 hypothetical protein [Betaproteobacteria bacterium]
MKFSDIWAYCQNNWAFAVLAVLMSPVLLGLYLLHLMASLVAPIAEVYVQNEKQKYLRQARIEGRKILAPRQV